MAHRLERHLLPALLALAVAADAGAQSAQQPLAVTAENVTAIGSRNQDGPSRDEALRIGDVVRYRLVFTNVTEAPLDGVQVVNPVPSGLVYELGSAGAEGPSVAIDFSVDGGQTFTPRPMVLERVNGEEVQTDAPPTRYTHVRWRYLVPLAEQQVLRADFKARFVGPAPEGSAAGPLMNKPIDARESRFNRIEF